MQVETTQPNREMPEVPSYAMRVVDALEAGDRGDNGFGSTGR